MAEGRTLGLALAIIFIIGGVVPLVVGSFYDVSEVEPTGVYGAMKSLFVDGFTIFTFNVNIFGWTGNGTQEFIGDQIDGYYIFSQEYPTLANGIFIICALVIGYALVKALPTT